MPISLQPSPLNPNTEMMIVMKAAESIDKFIYDQDFPKDEEIVARRFTVRAFQFIQKEQ